MSAGRAVRGIRDSIPAGYAIGRPAGAGTGPAVLIPLGPSSTVSGGGGSSPAFADDITPTGVIDGANVTFTLPQTPSPATSLQLFKNGVLMRPGGVDYTLSGATITYVAGVQPQSGEAHVCWYRF